ncbi:glycosyltransferase involved in cell wall biosynthesis [Pedobacter sp. UYP30]|uniref:glycosyltransferase n=1 Tax=Pedobacter sp. UYP30 TaxID=1756400 RepID=UPI0033997C1C
MSIFLYAVLIFLVIRFSVTLFNFLSNPRLPKLFKHFSTKVSILIPARNEQENIIKLLLSIKNQDYEHYEVLILDDHSEDNTCAVVSKFCAENPKFRIIRGKELPIGWLGKNFACHQLAALATGAFLFFLDADEEIKPGLINSMLTRMELGSLSLLSIFTNQQMLTLGEKLTVPLMHYILLSLLPLRLVKLSKNPMFAAASGQCMFFEAKNYKDNCWHQEVKREVVEDIEIMKLVKQRGFKTEALLGNNLIYCRMYSGLKEAVDGFSKNLLAGFGKNIWILLGYLTLVIVGPVLLFLNFNLAQLVLPLTIILLGRVMISLLSGQKIIENLVLHPIQMAFFLIIAIVSIKKYLFKSGAWKGRQLQTRL